MTQHELELVAEIYGDQLSLLEELEREKRRQMRRWTDAEEIELVVLLSRGESLGVIAEKLGRSYPSVRDKARRVTARATRSKKHWARGEVSRLIEMYRRGENINAIAAALGRSAGAVRLRIHRLRAAGVLEKREAQMAQGSEPDMPPPPRVSREEFERRVDVWAVSLGLKPVFGGGQ